MVPEEKKMGGCYTNYSRQELKEMARQEQARLKAEREEADAADSNKLIKSFLSKGKREDLISAYKIYSSAKSAGFIEEIVKASPIKTIDKIPKEYDGIEYEVKFDLSLSSEQGKAEPELSDILDVFDFPPTKSARFIKDAMHSVAEGINNFYGTATDEKLVVIEKAGNLYLKEKSAPLELRVDVPYKDIVVKREEKRYKASFTDVQEKIAEVVRETGAAYVGKIRKEKADDFVLDTNDGRLYSFTLTRAHLVKPGEKTESAVQRQLEIEYAGFIPGFDSFKKDSEEQIIRGMVDVAKYCSALYNGAPVKGGSTLSMRPTHERKFDFINGKLSLPQSEYALPGGIREGITVGSISAPVREKVLVERKPSLKGK